MFSGLIFLTLHVGIPITSPQYWLDEDECTLDSLKHVFRSATEEEMPMLKERLMCLREAGQVLDEVIPLFALCFNAVDALD